MIEVEKNNDSCFVRFGRGDVSVIGNSWLLPQGNTCFACFDSNENFIGIEVVG